LLLYESAQPIARAEAQSPSGVYGWKILLLVLPNQLQVKRRIVLVVSMLCIPSKKHKGEGEKFWGRLWLDWLKLMMLKTAKRS